MKFRLNVFYLISSVCFMILVGYLWLVYLPVYEFTTAYGFVKRVVSIITVLLVLSAGIQLFLAIKKR
ncbi:hypothetical protein DRO35_03200 [Candidatus Bathyarchaeota archaeon]|nr:MAG: hypothetical protein DRO35_03200 [Candidatus Bathyarchaeota archaeon]